MEPDEVFSNLSEKLSALDDKISGVRDRLDSIQSSFGDQKSAVGKVQSDIDQINATLNDLKSGANTGKQDNSQQIQSLADKYKQIQDMNIAMSKQVTEEQGLVGKLAAQAEDAGKMLANMGDTTNAIVKKAWDDGKKEILSTWEDSKKDILNSVSSLTTGWIKDAQSRIKDEIKDELKSLILDDVKSAQADAKSSEPAAIDDAALEAKIRKVMKQVAEGG